MADQRLTVSWQPLTQLRDGSLVEETVRYQVYRSNNGKDFSRIGVPVDHLSYVDQGLRNGRKYFYQVKALRTLDGTDMYGEVSDVVSGQPRDLTPPAPPHQFTVMATPEGVAILWESVAATDVAGYRIYRRSAGEEDFVLVGETGGRTFSFTDRNLPPGNELLYYAVTAFDGADPPNESAFSQLLEFRR